MSRSSETLPYSERSILVLGGSSGIGLEAVAHFRGLGAKVYIGSSRGETYLKALDDLERRRRMDVSSGILPFVADVRNKAQLEQAAVGIKTLGPNLTDVIFSQAGGMESFTEDLFKRHIDPIVDDYTLNTPLEELDQEKQAIVRERLAEMRADLAVWTEEALPNAVAVNYQGTFNAIDILGNRFPDGFTGVFYNSTWGHLSGTPGVEIPLLYRPIDLSKARVRNRLQDDGLKLLNQGIPIVELIASLVNDTKVGKMFNDFLLNIMTKDQREAVTSSSIHTRDVVAATKSALECSVSEWQTLPRILYAYAVKGVPVISEEMELSAMYTQPYLF